MEIGAINLMLREFFKSVANAISNAVVEESNTFVFRPKPYFFYLRFSAKMAMFYLRFSAEHLHLQPNSVKIERKNKGFSYVHTKKHRFRLN